MDFDYLSHRVYYDQFYGDEMELPRLAILSVVHPRLVR